jgi:2-polyprenyl-3-methyl-5-hydroxy-6-metoxy-1,4-benzoquinol methylase
MHKLNQCPICRQNVAERCRDAVRCTSCGLMFKNESFVNRDLSELYKKAWDDVHNEIGGTDIRLARIYAKKIALSLGLKDFAGLKILEFGAGRGYMLAALSELGASVYAVEPFGHDYLKNKGFEVFRSLNDLPCGILFDGIVTIDVIEHVFDPLDEICRLHKFLRVKGWFYIATPNSNGFSSCFLGKSWKQFTNPSHVYLFNDKSMKRVFTELGFTKFKRLNWFVRYSNNFIAMMFHFFLQLVRLDGEIRYLMFKV